MKTKEIPEFGHSRENWQAAVDVCWASFSKKISIIYSFYVQGEVPTAGSNRLPAAPPGGELHRGAALIAVRERPRVCRKRMLRTRRVSRVEGRRSGWRQLRYSRCTLHDRFLIRSHLARDSCGEPPVARPPACDSAAHPMHVVNSIARTTVR